MDASAGRPARGVRPGVGDRMRLIDASGGARPHLPVRSTRPPARPWPAVPAPRVRSPHPVDASPDTAQSGRANNGSFACRRLAPLRLHRHGRDRQRQHRLRRAQRARGRRRHPLPRLCPPAHAVPSRACGPSRQGRIQRPHDLPQRQRCALRFFFPHPVCCLPFHPLRFTRSLFFSPVVFIAADRAVVDQRLLFTRTIAWWATSRSSRTSSSSRCSTTRRSSKSIAST